MTTHEVIRNMALRLGDEESHFTKSELRENAEQAFQQAKHDFEIALKDITSDVISSHVLETAMIMVYAYGDWLAEKGIRLGMQVMAEQVIAKGKNNENSGLTHQNK